MSYRTTLLLSVATAAAVALSTAALAAPAGDEYLPKVPNAAGSSSPAKGNVLSSGSGETTTGTIDSGSTTTGAPKSKDDQNKDQKGKSDDRDSTTAVAAGDTGSSGGGGSSGLIVLLLIVVAVIVVAGGMILRRRAGLSDDEGEGRGNRRGPDGASSARPTPDGEIVAGREKI